jgi:hypothetical protein
MLWLSISWKDHSNALEETSRNWLYSVGQDPDFDCITASRGDTNVVFDVSFSYARWVTSKCYWSTVR